MGEYGAIAALVVSLVGTGVSTYASYQSSQNEEDTANYNAAVAEQEAKAALQTGAAEALAKKEKARKVAATQAETAAASGLSTASGTPLALLTETAGIGAYDAETAMNDAQKEAYGYKSQSSLYSYQASNADTTGYLNASGTFLNGTSSAYYNYSKTGSSSKTKTS